MDGSVTTCAANQRHIQKTGVGGGARIDTFGLLNDGQWKYDFVCPHGNSRKVGNVYQWYYTGKN